MILAREMVARSPTSVCGFVCISAMLIANSRCEKDRQYRDDRNSWPFSFSVLFCHRNFSSIVVDGVGRWPHPGWWTIWCKMYILKPRNVHHPGICTGEQSGVYAMMNSNALQNAAAAYKVYSLFKHRRVRFVHSLYMCIFVCLHFCHVNSKFTMRKQSAVYRLPKFLVAVLISIL